MVLSEKIRVTIKYDLIVVGTFEFDNKLQCKLTLSKLTGVNASHTTVILQKVTRSLNLNTGVVSFTVSDITEDF